MVFEISVPGAISLSKELASKLYTLIFLLCTRLLSVLKPPHKTHSSNLVCPVSASQSVRPWPHTHMPLDGGDVTPIAGWIYLKAGGGAGDEVKG